MMTRSVSTVFVLLLLICGGIPAIQAQGAPDVTWEQVQSTQMDSSLAFAVQDLSIPFGSNELRLKSGTIMFQQSPAPTSAVFFGQGQLKWAPTDPIEIAQLKRFTGASPFETEFDEAVFWFSEDLLALVKAKAQPGSGDPASFGGKLKDRQSFYWNIGTNFPARAMEGRYNPASVGFIIAEINAKKGGRLLVGKDLGSPEELSLTRLVKTQFPAWYFEGWSRYSLASAPPHTSPEPRSLVAVTHHDIELSIEGNEYLSGKDALQFEVLVDGLRAVPFDFNKKLRISSVSDSTGKPLQFVQPPLIDRDDDQWITYYASNRLLVLLPKPAAKSEKLAISVQFKEQEDEGKMVQRQGEGVYFVPNSDWYPDHGDLINRRATYRMRFTYPSKYDLASIGKQVRLEKEGDRKIADWEMSFPVAVAGFSYGEFKVAEFGRVKVFANIYADDAMRQTERIAARDGWDKYVGAVGAGMKAISPAAQAEPMAQEVNSSLDFFSQYFGDYQYPQLNVSSITTWSGQGWPSLLYLSGMTFLDSTQRNSMGLDLRGQRVFGEEMKAHETSHQWWGHAVAWKSYRDQWLSEGFAKYSGLLYSAKVNGDERLMTSLKLDRDDLLVKSLEGPRFIEFAPIWLGYRLDSEKERMAYANIVYTKGAWVVHMIRCMFMDFSKMDDTYFRNVMKDFVYTYKNKSASTQDFKRIMDKHMGQDTQWFFDQWIYGTEVPTYKTSWESVEQDGKNMLNVRVLQEGVSPSFKAYLPIRIKLANGNFAVIKLPVQGPETKRSLALPMKATDVEFNYYSGVLTK